MPNTFFQFKQFTVQQERSAMKVCTDACLFGAYVAGFSSKLSPQPTSILDIGTGTGLLALMLAQQCNAAVDAVEQDKSAAGEAMDNFMASPWAGRMRIYHTRMQDYQPAKQYDLIICNPPFYENSLVSEDEKRSQAMHEQTLRWDELFSWINANLGGGGYAALLVPFGRSANAIMELRHIGLYLSAQCNIRQTMGHDFFRSVLIVSKQKTETVMTEEITIRESETEYSEAFRKLLKAYYLSL